jgi:pimeloyl-ACP methyl ester carboxylesterase
MDELRIKHQMFQVNGINMHVAENGEGPVVLLLHGFPEFWYGWRCQLTGLAQHGFRAVAPDLRGYGDSSAPPETTSYTILHLVGDIVALMDALEQPQVCIVQTFCSIMERCLLSDLIIFAIYPMFSLPEN